MHSERNLVLLYFNRNATSYGINLKSTHTQKHANIVLFHEDDTIMTPETDKPSSPSNHTIFEFLELFRQHL